MKKFIYFLKKLFKSNKFLFYFIQYHRRARYDFTLPIARLLSKLLKSLPKHEKYEIIFHSEFNRNVNKEINSLLEDGIIISKLKDKSTLKSLENLQKELKIYEELNDSDKKSKSSKVSQDKSFLKIITNYFSKSDLLALAYDPEIIQMVYSYFGFYPSIYKIYVWHTQRCSDLPSTTQFFHRDPEDVNLLKLFVPLKEINCDNGPFQYISKTHKKFLKEEFDINIGLRDPIPQRLKLEKEIEKNNFSNIVTFIGEPTSFCLVDTNGLHRGKFLKEGSRFLVNIVYTSNFPHMGSPLPKNLKLF